jgi:hypothetical protein
LPPSAAKRLRADNQFILHRLGDIGCIQYPGGRLLGHLCDVCQALAGVRNLPRRILQQFVHAQTAQAVVQLPRKDSETVEYRFLVVGGGGQVSRRQRDAGGLRRCLHAVEQGLQLV